MYNLVADHRPLAGELDRLVIGGKESAIGMLAEPQRSVDSEIAVP